MLKTLNNDAGEFGDFVNGLTKVVAVAKQDDRAIDEAVALVDDAAKRLVVSQSRPVPLQEVQEIFYEGTTPTDKLAFAIAWLIGNAETSALNRMKPLVEAIPSPPDAPPSDGADPFDEDFGEEAEDLFG